MTILRTALLAIATAWAVAGVLPAQETRTAQTPASAVDSGCAPARPSRPPAAAGATTPGSPPGYDERPAGPPRKRLLIWADTRNGIGQHDIAHAMAVIEEMGYQLGLYDSYIRTDSAIISKRPVMTDGKPASGGPNLCNVDAIFFLGHREIDIDQQQRADLLWFVHDQGKGFVAAHTGTAAFLDWPEFGNLIGGRFDTHPWGVTNGTIIVTDPKFPGVQEFGKTYQMREEFYQIKDFDPTKSHIIMRLDTSALDMTRPQVQKGDYPYPLTWAKMYGKGRVFYSALGHAPSTWDNPAVREMYLEAIKWALGMTNADLTPIAVPPTNK